PSVALGVQPGDLEIEIVLDAAHHLVADLPRVAQLDDRMTLGLQQLATQPLVLERPLLDLAVPVRVDPRREAVDPEPVRTTEALGRVVPHRAFGYELVEAVERRLGGA